MSIPSTAWVLLLKDGVMTDAVQLLVVPATASNQLHGILSEMVDAVLLRMIDAGQPGDAHGQEQALKVIS